MVVIQRQDPQTIQKHEKYLLKHFLQINYQKQLISGSLSELPQKQIIIPSDYVNGANNTNGLDEYEWRITDSNGVLKIDNNGCLRLLDENKKFLFNYFQLPTKGFKYFVLIKELIDALQLKCTVDEFISKYNELLLPLKINENQDWEFLVENKLVEETTTNRNEYQVITTRSAFIVFGASIISCGVRIVDDYWENLFKREGFTPHHRVFRYNDKLINLLKIMKPAFFEDQNGYTNNSNEQDNEDTVITAETFEQPFNFISEQNSLEIKNEYIRQFTQGEHITTVVPGQNISGSLEISAQFKLPKYHFKNSFLHAIQNNSLDVPIGHSVLQRDSTNTTEIANHVELADNKISNSNDNPVSVPQMTTTSTTKDGENLSSSLAFSSSLLPHGKPTSLLNFNGWKFDSLPIQDGANIIDDQPNDKYSLKGLPLYRKGLISERLAYLTPNQIKEIEHQHDSLFVNVGLQRVRKIRNGKWLKFWQYKSGIPIGLLKKPSHLNYYHDKYLQDIISQVDTITTINEYTNQEEIQTTTRRPNANFLKNSNIKSFKPPYA